MPNLADLLKPSSEKEESEPSVDFDEVRAALKDFDSAETPAEIRLEALRFLVEISKRL